METKRCTRCKHKLPLDSFGMIMVLRADGKRHPYRRARCIKCCNLDRQERRSKYYKAVVKWRRSHREKVNEMNKRQRDDLRRTVLSAYSADNPPRCACCKTSFGPFLTIDHINGNGSQHRRELRQEGLNRTTGVDFYRWIRRQGFPPGFRVLCFNCNYALPRYGHDVDKLRKAIRSSL